MKKTLRMLEKNSIKVLVEDIRQKQKLAKDEIETIQEGLLNEPPEKEQSVGTGEDPLAPLDKQFPNLKSLAEIGRASCRERV